MPPWLYPPLAWISSLPDTASLNPRAIPASLKPSLCSPCLCWSPELTSLRRTFPGMLTEVLILVLWGHPWVRKELSALPASSPGASQQEQWDLLPGSPEQHPGWDWSRDVLHELWKAEGVTPGPNPHPGTAHPHPISSQSPLDPCRDTRRTLTAKGAGGSSNLTHP